MEEVYSSQARSILEHVHKCAQRHGSRSFIVGGAVRDHLLRVTGSIDTTGAPIGGALRDLDIVIEGDAIEIARDCHRVWGGELKTFDAFGTAKILYPTAFSAWEEVDFAATRTEHYPRPGALPEVARGTLESDLRRRDFSINAMAVQVADALPLVSDSEILDNSKLIDQFDGLKDLKNRHVRVLHPRSFIDDPTRIFRAVRYKVRFDFALEETTRAHFEEAIHKVAALETISSMRIWNEVRKFAAEAKGKRMILRAAEIGLFKAWIPLRAVTTEQLRAHLPDAHPSDLDLLRLFRKLGPEVDPRHWGLNLPKAVLAQLLDSGQKPEC